MIPKFSSFKPQTFIIWVSVGQEFRSGSPRWQHGERLILRWRFLEHPFNYTKSTLQAQSGVSAGRQSCIWWYGAADGPPAFHSVTTCCVEWLWHGNMHDSPFLASYLTSIWSHLKISFSGPVWPWMLVVSFLCRSTEATELSSKLKEKLAGWDFLRSDMSACCTSWVSKKNFQGQFSLHVIFALQEVLEPVPVEHEPPLDHTTPSHSALNPLLSRRTVGPKREDSEWS